MVSLKKQHDVKKCCKEVREKKNEERDREEGFQKTGHNVSYSCMLNAYYTQLSKEASCIEEEHAGPGKASSGEPAKRTV